MPPVATGLSLREASALVRRWRDGSGGGAEPEQEGWCFYLLQSADGRRIYEGATNNPPRRLAKHNGFVHGGACKTRTGRPWSMVLFVHGFRSKRDALSFERAMQRPRVCSPPAPAVAGPFLAVCAGKCAACVWSPLTGCGLPMAIGVAALPRAASAIHRLRSRIGVASECLRLPAHVVHGLHRLHGLQASRFFLGARGHALASMKRGLPKAFAVLGKLASPAPLVRGSVARRTPSRRTVCSQTAAVPSASRVLAASRA